MSGSRSVPATAGHGLCPSLALLAALSLLVATCSWLPTMEEYTELNSWCKG
jgi:hypothetical protein